MSKHLKFEERLITFIKFEQMLIIFATIIHKIFETNSCICFHVKQRTTEKIDFLFFNKFFLVPTKFSFREED